MEMVYKLFMDIVVNYMYLLDKLYHKDKALQLLALQEILQDHIYISKLE